MTTTLIGISGSLRRDSYNTRLLRAAEQRMPDGARLDIRSIGDIPLYNFDVESNDGIPKPVADLKDAIASANGLVICSPEYNSSVPGVLKNAIDWLTRPSKDIPRVFGGRPVAQMGATPGGFGTVSAQNAWLPVFRALGARLWSGGRLMAPRAGQLFDDDGRLVDDAMIERMEAFLSGFVAFAAGLDPNA